MISVKEDVGDFGIEMGGEVVGGVLEGGDWWILGILCWERVMYQKLDISDIHWVCYWGVEDKKRVYKVKYNKDK